MSEQIRVSKKVFIRDAGHDEYWLQDRIYENPSILGLGDLVQVSKEKKQSSGGILDMLLKDPEDDSMYEIEVMLGETNPSHIIRSIEYWDLEKRRYPQRGHFSVLIAESFERRYFNIVHLLSLNIPMIAIQVELLEVEGQHVLNFTKILDIYEEPAPEEEETSISPASEDSWKADGNWTLDAAKELLRVLKILDNELTLNFTQSYVSIVKQNNRPLYWLNKRATPKSYLSFRERDDKKVEAIKSILDKQNISFSYKNKDSIFIFTLGKDYLTQQENTFKEIHNIRFPVKGEISSEDTSD